MGKERQVKVELGARSGRDMVKGYGWYACMTMQVFASGIQAWVVGFGSALCSMHCTLHAGAWERKIPASTEEARWPQSRESPPPKVTA
eukprot:scaffold318902_cov18-Tisochrysis_lutea.AAC.1